MNFKDPVSTFAYNLVSLHHDIMWYIIIILSVVYWCLYKILKEYIWTNFNKQEGFLLILYSSNFLFKIQKFIIYIWVTVFVYNVAYFFAKFYFWLVKKFDIFLLNKKNKKLVKDSNLISLISFLLGSKYFTGFYYNYAEQIRRLSVNDYENIILQRFISYYLFSKTSNGLFFYEGYDKPLNTLRYKHSINLEYVFGMFPTIIIGLIIVPSMYLLYSNESDINPCLTVKIIGHQWYWSYESTSVNVVKNKKEIYFLNYYFDSVMINEIDLVKGHKRLLDTDKSLVLPYNSLIRLVITSVDVLHSWSLPEFGIKVDAVPGRLNQVITSPNNLGIYYGQCSELCGVSHGFMPIKVNVISLLDYYNLILKK